MLKNNFIDNRRISILQKGNLKQGTVVYWMSRDQRANDNWALLYAQDIALETRSKLAVVFCLVPEFLNSDTRNFLFMLKGLKELYTTLENNKIPLIIVEGYPHIELSNIFNELNTTILITDFDPLKIKINWKKQITNRIALPIYEVDTHNIIPCKVTSQKQEWGAYTIRPKIKKLLPEFLTEFPKLENYQYNSIEFINYCQNRNTLDFSAVLNHNYGKYGSLKWIETGEEAAIQMLQKFIIDKLINYSINKNNPQVDGLSNLSPYIHFGMISSQRIALEVEKSEVAPDTKNCFFEELIVRKELSDNYCLYNHNYDNFDGFPNWAKDTLNKHRKDKREIIYSIDDLEKIATHDKLWNYSQNQLLTTGKMHGYLRMYWAKKILEWSNSPEEAQELAIYFNDKYSLDGRDPNGYTGIAWSIGGLHDRPWKERNIFGKIRYMSFNSQIKKIGFNFFR